MKDGDKLSRKEIRQRAKLQSGWYGSKQGKKMTLGVTIANEKFNPDKPISRKNQEMITVSPNYKNSEGVKAKDIKDATVVKSKYDKARGRLGGGVGRIPKDKTTPLKLESVYSVSRKFEGKADEKDPNNQELATTIETKGYDVKSKSSKGLAKKVDDALTKTDIGKNISQKDKEFKEAPEFGRNDEKSKLRNRYAKGSRTVTQVIENSDVKTANEDSKLKVGSRKLNRFIKGKLKKNNK